MDLNFTIEKQVMKRIDTEVPVSDSSMYLRLCFTFSEEWTDLDKYCFFRVNHVNYPYPITDDMITVPAIFVSGKELIFGVYGVDADYRITTNLLRVHLEDSFYDTEEIDIRNWLEKDIDGINEHLASLDELVEGKSDVGHIHDDRYYTESECDDRYYTKPVSDGRYYTKSDSDGRYYTKTDSDDRYYTKTDSDDRYYTKSQSNTRHYSKSETDDLLDLKVDKIGGKALSSNDFTDHYKNLLDGFDGDIETFLLEHKAEIEALITEEVLDTKVDKVEGKELSSNDFSDLYKEILDTMEDNYFKKSELKTEPGKLTRLNGETVYGEFLLVKPPEYGMIISFTGEVFESPLYNNHTKFEQGVIIDWGDGTTTTYQYRTALYHQYSEYGQYTIKISPVIYAKSQVAFNGMTNPNSKVGVKLPSHFLSVPNNYFYNSPSVVNVIIPQSVTSIGEEAFIASGLTSIELPSSLTSIGANAFQNCQGLTSIELPSSLTSIGGMAFYDCNALKKYILNWESSETILRYTQLISWSPAPTDITFSIPTGTTDLYTAKGYPSDKLIERG